MMSSKMRRFLPMAFIVGGAVLMHTYLYTVRLNTTCDIVVLFGGAFAQSIGVLLLLLPMLYSPQRLVDKTLFVACVLILSFSVTLVRVTRFPVPLQADTAPELQAARFSYDAWSPGAQYAEAPPRERGYLDTRLLPIYPYYACLSVTILPSILSRVLGIDLISLFQQFTFILVALIPLGFFVVMRRFFGDRPEVYVAAALTPEILFFTQYMSFFRSAIAMFMAYMVLYSLSLKTRRGLLLATLFAFGVITSHHTAAYFLIMLLIFFAIVNVVPRRLFGNIKLDWFGEKLVAPSFLALLVGMQISWLLFNANLEFLQHADGVILYFKHLNLLSFSPEVSYIGARGPRGPIVQAWFMLQFMLMTVGGLIGVYYSLKGKFRGVKASWIMVGCLAGAYIVACALLPNYQTAFSIFIEPARAVAYSLPFAMLFLAMTLVKLSAGKFRILTILFITLMLPMNMMLPSHQHDLMFHPDSTQPAETLANFYAVWAWGSPCLHAANWIGERIGTEDWVQTDAVGGQQMCLGQVPWGRLIRWEPPKMTPSTLSREMDIRAVHYLVVHRAFLDGGVWAIDYSNRTCIISIYDPNILLQSTVSNLVYSNHRLALFWTD